MLIGWLEALPMWLKPADCCGTEAELADACGTYGGWMGEKMDCWPHRLDIELLDGTGDMTPPKGRPKLSPAKHNRS